MTLKERIIRSLVYSASGRFSACETEQDFATQQRLYGELLEERIAEVVAAERARVYAALGEQAMIPDEIAARVVAAFTGDEYWIDKPSSIAAVAAALRDYGAARAAAERRRAAQIASRVFLDDPYALHPDIPFARLNDAAQMAAYSIAQTIADLILDQADPGAAK